MDIPEGHPSGVDVRAFLQEVEPQIHDKLEEEILALNGIKFQRHKQEVLLQASRINEDLNKAIPHFLGLLEKWTQRGSGWLVDRVQTLWLDIARYQPLRGGSYIPLPAAVRSKKAVINVKNRDDHCLRWALRWLWHIHRHHITQRPRRYPTEDGLNFQGVDAPTPISQIPKVEKLNNLAINVFGWDKGVTVYRLSTQPDGMPR